MARRRKAARRGFLSRIADGFGGTKHTRRRSKRVTGARLRAIARGADPRAAADAAWSAVWRSGSRR